MKPVDIAKLMHSLQSLNVPAEARADALIYNVTAGGLDMRPPLAQLIREADEGRALKAEAAKEKEKSPLSPETFVGEWDMGVCSITCRSIRGR